ENGVLAATKLLTARYDHVSAVLENGRVLIASGSYAGYGTKNTRYLSSTEIFDPTSGNIESGPEMNEKRDGAASAVLNGTVYVCGGYNGSTYLASCEKYQSNRWQPIASMNAKRGYHIMASLYGYLFACGGLNGTAAINACEQY